MANEAQKLSNRPAAGTLTGAELTYVVQGGVSKKSTLTAFKNWILGFVETLIDDHSEATDPHGDRAYTDSVASTKLDAVDYVQHFKGKYTTLLALQTAHPTGSEGDYAIVDGGISVDAKQYIWDSTDSEWIEAAITPASSTDEITEGSTNLYFTAARVRAVALTGLSLATGTAIDAADTILSAFGKLQKQISDLSSSLSGYLTTSSAASTYLTQSNASSTYLSQSNASTTYATIANQRFAFVSDAGATYTVPASAVTENGRTIVELSNGSLTSITIDANTGTGKTTGDSVHISITGAYAAQALVASGVTLQGTLTFSKQYQTKTLVYKGSNIWRVIG